MTFFKQYDSEMNNGTNAAAPARRIVGVAPAQFTRGIDSASADMGNRVFMRWVGALHAGGLDAGDQPAGMPGRPPAAPLQLMPKKHRKKTKAPPRAVEERMSRPDPGHAVPDLSKAGAGAQSKGAETPVVAPVKAAAELNYRESVLFDCCLKGEVRGFRRCFNPRTIDANLAIEQGTLLYLATIRGHTAIVKELVSKPGIDVNLAIETGATPLSAAAEMGRTDLVELLLAAPGVNPDLGTFRVGTTALTIATSKGHLEVVRLLVAARNCNVNVRQHKGSTALFIAAQNGFPKIVELLVRNGAGVNLALDDGTSPLCAAAFRGNIEVVKRLLEAPDIRVDHTTHEQVTALAYATTHGHVDVVKFLLDKKADPNIADDEGVAPLHIACIYGFTDIAGMLLNAGADTELRAGGIYTPYLIAGWADQWAVAALLRVHRLKEMQQAAKLAELSLEDLPVPPAPGKVSSAPSHQAGLVPVAQPGETETTLAPTLESEAAGGTEPAGAGRVAEGPVDMPELVPGNGSRSMEPQSPVARARKEFVREILEKLRGDWLDPLDGIRLLEAVNTVTDLDGLCTIYNRSASIERKKARTRGRSTRHHFPATKAQAARADAGPCAFVLGDKSKLDAGAVEVEIRRYLEPRYHRFISQAVNDMEFGRGKTTSGYPGLLHVSAGIAGVGSCSVFFYQDADSRTIRIAGIGHHLDRANYRLTYTAAELRGLRTLALQLMPKRHGKKAKPAAQMPGTPRPATPETATVTLETPGTPGAGIVTKSGEGSPQAEPEGADVALVKKKKRTPRVQVALNTLRTEGVTRFGRYIDAEIGEAGLLRSLSERINRAGDLGNVRDGALSVVRARLKALDLQAAATGGGQAVEKAVLASFKTVLNPREMELYKCCMVGDVRKLRQRLRFGAVDINMAIPEATLIGCAANHGHINVVRELLSVPGIDVNLAQEGGATPIYLVAQEGRAEIVDLLLSARGINPNLATLVGGTPLSIAAQKGHVAIVESLLKFPSIQVDARRDDGVTPLLCATQKGNPRVVEMLLSAGARVNIQFRDGTAPLHIAVNEGYIETTKALLRSPDIQVDLKMNFQSSALGIACRRGNDELVRLLLEHGADPDLVLDKGLVALHLACLMGYTGIAAMLLEAGANPDAKTHGTERFTPYQLARLRSHEDIIHLLEKHRLEREVPQSGIKELSLQDRPDQAAPATGAGSMPVAQPGPLPETGQGSGSGQAGPEQTGTAEAASPFPAPAGTTRSAQPQSPLQQVKSEFITTVLEKLRNDWLDPLDGIRLLEQVNQVSDLDGLCTILNRLAGIERRQYRAGRRPMRRSGSAAEAPPVAEGPCGFMLGERRVLDAEAVEQEIKRRLEQRYHRFVSSAVNDMEFGRGKLTTGYPGLLHVSAGIPGVGSCSVFFYPEEDGKQFRIVGLGHHLDRGTYRLDYGAGELRDERTVQLMPRRHKRKETGTPEKRGEESSEATLETPAGQGACPGPEPGDTSLETEPEAATAVKKKKKKPRMQVALNTLRKEGVEAFRDYLEVAIGEIELLQTLIERITRAQDLGGMKDAALRVVMTRLMALDLRAGAAAAQAVAAGKGEIAESAVVLPMIMNLGHREQALVDSCARGDIRKFRQLLRFGSIDINMVTNSGTLLSLAAFYGHTAIVRELLSRPDCDRNLPQWTGATPLYLAAQHGYVEIMRLLLAEHGIKTNLGERGHKTTPLIIAAHRGQEEAVKLLLADDRVRVNLRQADGATAVFAASEGNFPRVVEALVRHGADANAALFDGTSALCRAAFNGYNEVLKYLLQAPGIQVDQRLRRQSTALFFASQQRNKEGVELLLAAGADTGLPDENQVYPLHMACLHGAAEIVELLLDAGADMEIKVENKHTAYDIARIRGNLAIMNLLEERMPGRMVQQSRIEELPPRIKPAEPAPLPGSGLVSEPEPKGSGQTVAAEAASPAPVSPAPVAQPQLPLQQAKSEFIATVLEKLRNDWLDPLDGIRLLEQVNQVADLDGLCTILNRLAGIERRQYRAGRRPMLRSAPAAEAHPVAVGPGGFALGEKRNLDADAVEEEIKRRLEQRYHRFVSSAVNDMEFGRGKKTTGYPGLLHVSAGIPGMGSCSVFFFPGEEGGRFRIVGLGHHLDRGTYRLDYAADELQETRMISL